MAKPAGSLWKRAPGVVIASLLCRPSYSSLIRAFLLTSSYSSLIGSSKSLITEWLILFWKNKKKQFRKFVLFNKDELLNEIKIDYRWCGQSLSHPSLSIVLYLTNRTQHEPKCDSRSEPAIFQNTTSALKVEHVSAVQLFFFKKRNNKR